MKVWTLAKTFFVYFLQAFEPWRSKKDFRCTKSQRHDSEWSPEDWLKSRLPPSTNFRFCTNNLWLEILPKNDSV